jgi:hypothetical protein
LSVRRVWFDKIASGDKKKEYRRGEIYWMIRLMDKNGDVRQFDEIEFRNGYGFKVPRMVFKCQGIIYQGGQFEISIGDRIS